MDASIAVTKAASALYLQNRGTWCWSWSARSNNCPHVKPNVIPCASIGRSNVRTYRDRRVAIINMSCAIMVYCLKQMWEKNNNGTICGVVVKREHRPSERRWWSFIDGITLCLSASLYYQCSNVVVCLSQHCEKANKYSYIYDFQNVFGLQAYFLPIYCSIFYLQSLQYYISLPNCQDRTRLHPFIYSQINDASFFFSHATWCPFLINFLVLHLLGQHIQNHYYIELSGNPKLLKAWVEKLGLSKTVKFSLKWNNANCAYRISM